MAGRSIDTDISRLIVKATDVADTEPIYALLLCRQACEAILMKKHIGIISKNAEPKEVLTLGDLDNTKLDLKKHFTDIESASIRYVQAMTNPFVHYRRSEVKIPNKEQIHSVLKQIGELHSPEASKRNFENYINHNNQNFMIEQFKLTVANPNELRNKFIKKHLDWKQVLAAELKNFEWPNLNKTVLGGGMLGKIKGDLTMKRKKAENKLKSPSTAEVNKKGHEKRIRRLKVQRSEINRISKLPGATKMEFIKAATEEILIAYYAKYGGRDYASGEVKEDFIERAINTVFTQFTTSAATFHASKGKERKYWEFLFNRIGTHRKVSRQITLTQDWKFLYLE